MSGADLALVAGARSYKRWILLLDVIRLGVTDDIATAYAQTLLTSFLQGDSADSEPPSLPGAVIWVAEDLPANTAANTSPVLQHLHISEAKRLLGREYQVIVYDAVQLDANILAALSGAVMGNGLLLLLLRQQPSPRYLSFLRQRFIEYGARCERFLELSSPAMIAPLQQRLASASPRDMKALAQASTVLRANTEQRDFIERGVALLRRNRQQSERSLCLLLQARRGRGKSTALALLLRDYLLDENAAPVVLCAPSRRQADTLFAALGDVALSAERQGRLQFAAVDQLLARLTMNAGQEHAALQRPTVLVDEAASLPLSLLKQLADWRLPLVLATTTEGYEGSGRGFLLRYRNHLAAVYDQLQTFSFSLPQRWAASDVLEPFIDAVCGLGWHTEAPDSALSRPTAADLSRVRIEAVSSDQLLADPLLLSAVHALLVDSHYQTRPSDLQRLLDSDDRLLWVAWLDAVPGQAAGSRDAERSSPEVIAVLQVIEEGGLGLNARPLDLASAERSRHDNNYDDIDEAADDLAAQVAAGRRRPPGNLVAQKLASHYCQANWCRLRSLRVTRIAVAKPWQRQGIASRLLAAMIDSEAASRCAFWSSSFGHTDALQQFWAANTAELVYLGSKRDRASGEYNAIVVSALASALASTLAERGEQGANQGGSQGRSKGGSQDDSQTSFSALLDTTRQAFNADYALRPSVRSKLAEPSPSATVLSALRALDSLRLQRLLDAQIDWDSAYPSFVRQLLRSEQLADPRPLQAALQQAGLAAPRDIRLRFAEQAPDWKALASSLGLTGRAELINFARDYLRLLL